MKNRRKNNIIIGTLCCVLVLMGVGYAILSTTLNIGATAKITGDFDIHFLDDDQDKKGISLIDYDNSTSGNTIYNTTVNNTIAAQMESGTEVDSQDSTNATFSAILQKPTDYAIFTVTVKNYGSIDGYLTFSFEDTNDNFDYYDDFYSVEFIKEGSPGIKADILQNQTFSDNTVLSSGQSREYKIKVTFKESATSFPDTTTNGEFECALILTYSQNAPASNNNSDGSQSYPNDAWRVNSQGTVISYDPADLVEGTLTIPATDVNGNNIVSVNILSFLSNYNVVIYGLNDQQYAIIIDQEHYNNLADIVENIFEISNIYSSADHEVPLENDGMDCMYLNPLKTSETFDDEDFVAPDRIEISGLDLRQATHLTTIGAGTFVDSPISEIKFNNVLSTIGAGAFADSHLSGVLTIPSSVQTIEDGAFETHSDSEYKLTGLNLSNATSLTSIGKSAFSNQNISSLDLSGATHLQYLSGFENNPMSSITIPSTVTTIGNYAFSNNHLIGTLTIPSSVTTIGYGAFSVASDSEYKLTGLNLGNVSDLETIGEYAFNYQNISSLDLSGATHLTTIGHSAFYSNHIAGTLTIPSSVETIDSMAFYENRLTTVNLSNANSLTLIGSSVFGYQMEGDKYSTLTFINASNKTKAQYDTISNNNNWYDSSHPNFHITYSDQCVGNCS